ncbi:hypothetical protein CMUS01_06693 [Colletotrichum musicola]|uniref:Uncharacterized protein n=1 Tax=Colletotrichum musicola TaxID=2175873 RepID=A0A8H6NHW3_9PEZI|nr:hypothetical protein CMUS01_06693 [Colletotrichum musicola]
MNAKDRKQQTEPASTEEMSQSITCRILSQLLWSANCQMPGPCAITSRPAHAGATRRPRRDQYGERVFKAGLQ